MEKELKEQLTKLLEFYTYLLELLVSSYVYNYGFDFTIQVNNLDFIQSSWIEKGNDNTLFTDKDISLKQFLVDLQHYNTMFKSISPYDPSNTVLIQEYINDTVVVKYISKSQYLEMLNKK